MADSIVQSLFGPTPWQIQQAQNAGLAQAADKYASQDPFQRATGTLYRAGGMLAQPAAEAMGMVNPAMQEAQSRQQAMSGIDMSNGDSILRAAQGIADPRLKLQLTMLGQQRKAAEQEARNKSAMELKTLSAAEKDMALAEKALRENPNLAVTEVGVKDKPGYMQRVLFDKTKPDAPYQSIGEPYLSAAAARQTFNVSTGGGESKQPLAYVDEDGKVKWGTMTEARGKAPAAFDPITKQMVSAAGSQGKEIGEQRANVGKQEEALSSVKAAKDTLAAGIYSGFWGPMQKTAVSAIPGMNKKVVENTDVFLAQIGETVIPRLKEFGGNDSNQELQFLQKVAGGDITMQPKAIKTVLESAEKKIQRGIDRVKQGMNPNGDRQSTSSGDLMSAAKAELERRSKK